MRKVELVKGIHSSALGFGCAPILGSVDSSRARRVLDMAIDYGINHFDLARSYGFGDAERFVGKIFKGKRNNIIIASKFGIIANWKASIFKPLKPLIRKFKKQKSFSIGNAVATKANTALGNGFLDRIPIDKKTMKFSLENTLKALQTDYLDYFFVHDPIETLSNFEDLAAMAELLKSEGKIRGWGLAYMRCEESKHLSYFNQFDVLQFDNSPGAKGYEDVIANRALLPNVFFSPMKGGDITIEPVKKLEILFETFPRSVVLCSTFDEQHLKENVEAVSK